MIDNTPFGQFQYGATISTYVDTTNDLLATSTGTPIRNITVRNNYILNPRARSYH